MKRETALCFFAVLIALFSGSFAATDGEACFDVKTVTKLFGWNKDWTIGCSDGSCTECSNKREYEDFEEYVQKCCFPKEQDELMITCKNGDRYKFHEYEKGWAGGYLKIKGDRFCENFDTGKEYTAKLRLSELTNGDNTGSECESDEDCATDDDSVSSCDVDTGVCTKGDCDGRGACPDGCYCLMINPKYDMFNCVPSTLTPVTPDDREKCDLRLLQWKSENLE